MTHRMDKEKTPGETRKESYEAPAIIKSWKLNVSADIGDSPGGIGGDPPPDP